MSSVVLIQVLYYFPKGGIAILSDVICNCFCPARNSSKRLKTSCSNFCAHASACKPLREMLSSTTSYICFQYSLNNTLVTTL